MIHPNLTQKDTWRNINPSDSHDSEQEEKPSITLATLGALAPLVAGFFFLAESHSAFHSYPELSFLAVDMFTCGPNAQPQAALDVFVERLKPQQTVVHSLARGRQSTEG